MSGPKSINTVKASGDGTGAQPQAATGVQLYQGYLEGSNTDMTESMVSTMNLVRAYEANQKMLQMQDSTLKQAVNDVGKA